MKLNIYIMHSEGINYKEEIYKPLLKIGLMSDYYLILPLSTKYQSSYIKELLLNSDVVICNLTKFSFLANFELNNAIKLNKKIYYYIYENDKKIRKYANKNPIVYSNKEDFSNKVKTLLDSLDKKELLLNRDNIYSLGKLEK